MMVGGIGPAEISVTEEYGPIVGLSALQRGRGKSNFQNKGVSPNVNNVIGVVSDIKQIFFCSPF